MPHRVFHIMTIHFQARFPASGIIRYLICHFCHWARCRRPLPAILGESYRPVCDDFIHRHGLDKPIMVIWNLYKEIARMGTSIRFNKPVTEILVERLPTTLELSLVAMAFSVVLGIPLGIISAVKHNSSVDVGTMVIANIGVSMPVFWLGLMLAYLFALVLKDATVPAAAFWSTVTRN
jgi:peptide/nickel transport system permease protein